MVFSIGLNNLYGSGICLEQPRRILAIGESHFALVAERPIGALQANTGRRAPVPFQIAIFRQASSTNAGLQHILQEPRNPQKRALNEYDMDVSSVSIYKESVLAVLRWRDSETVNKIYKGSRGLSTWLDGWAFAEIVVWDWHTGNITSRIALHQETVGSYSSIFCCLLSNTCFI